MSLAQRVDDLATRIGQEVKAVRSLLPTPFILIPGKNMEDLPETYPNGITNFAANSAPDGGADYPTGATSSVVTLKTSTTRTVQFNINKSSSNPGFFWRGLSDNVNWAAWRQVDPYGLEIGDIKATRRSSSPGYLMCSGGEAAIASYPTLYAVLTNNGTVFPDGPNTNGAGAAGTTHFRLPDLRDRFPRGAGSSAALAADDGTVYGTARNARLLPTHDHSMTHNHTIAHSHAITDHSHTMAHSHGMAGHTHAGMDHQHLIGPHTHGVGSITATSVADRATGTGNRFGSPMSGSTAAATSTQETGASDRTPLTTGGPTPGSTDGSSAASTGAGGNDTGGSSAPNSGGSSAANTGSDNGLHTPFYAVNYMIKAL